MITCILLTAGESIRFGSPKALANLNGTKAIEQILNVLIQSSIEKIIVVTGANESLIKPYVFNHSKIGIVHNNDHKFGQTSSFQKGLNIVDNNSNGVMLWPVDCPFIMIPTIHDLVKHFNSENPEILIPSYGSKKGHPPIFNMKLKDEILALNKDQGLNQLILKKNYQTLTLNDPGIVKTFNTLEELRSCLN